MQDQNQIFFPPEWYPQSGIQLTWPHKWTDWAPILREVIPCFVSIAHAIMKRENLLIVCRNKKEVEQQLGWYDPRRVRFIEIATNDTWARDHGGITVLTPEGPKVYDFTFNGWGMKFPAGLDNLITRKLFYRQAFAEGVKYENMAPFVLEGGSIETDGQGTLLTTKRCLRSFNRNDHLSPEVLERSLKNLFGVERILWLHNGYLAGDDTDGHIDTLARFCQEDTIAYVQCLNKKDEHYRELQLMEKELQAFRQPNGRPYRLVPLPMANKYVWKAKRIPATYANFLIMNTAVLVPFYDSPKDEIARKRLKAIFPGRQIIGINCRPLIKQHGSLHCVTMQYPKDVLRF